MKTIAIIICVLCVPFTAQGEMVSNGLTPVAVTQSGSSCWASAGSEEIWASGWSVHSTPRETYSVIIAALGTGPGSTWVGVDWYFDTYWPAVKTSDVMRSGWGIESAVQDIREGWAVAIETFPQSGIGHGLAVWGYEEDAGTVEGFYFTNSYGNAALQYASINLNGSWYYGSGYVGSIIGLIPEDMYVATPDPPYVPQPDCPTPSVPEPAASVLMLVGWLCMVRREFA